MISADFYVAISSSQRESQREGIKAVEKCRASPDDTCAYAIAQTEDFRNASGVRRDQG
jgi:hypothetical protein